jgi:sarcosine oxidase gamma subunit
MVEGRSGNQRLAAMVGGHVPGDTPVVASAERSVPTLGPDLSFVLASDEEAILRFCC